jgi:hypothetical protein
MFKTFFKTFQIVFSLLIIALLIFGGYLTYLYTDAQNYTPDKTSQQFIELTKNQTDVISNSEKQTLTSISETNFLSNLQLETSLKSLRIIAKDRTSSIINKATTSENYSVYTVRINGNNKPDYDYKLFMESKGTWLTGGARSKIIKFEFPQLPTDSALTGSVDGVVNKIGENLVNLFNKSKNMLDKTQEEVKNASQVKTDTVNPVGGK